MSDSISKSTQLASAVPPDDPHRKLRIARPNKDQNLPPIGLEGDTF